ncbi:MAG: SMC-Scp complex subunit ScpB [Clostridia bacterium]|nr:SMC-Scp complex subunit ScpB [Clostridia bacterium]
MDNKFTNTDVSPCSYSMEEQFGIIEACLFAAGHPLSYARLAEVLGTTPSECADTVEKMAAVYNNSAVFPRGILLVRFPDSCQLCTRENYGAQIKAALGIRRGGTLSQSLLEVLAVVAYNQPATRTFVDTVRGVDSSYAMNALTEKNLIEPCGKLDAPGRPTLYRTTTDFLRVFGLSELSELPAVMLRSDSGESVEITPQLEDVPVYGSVPDENAPEDTDSPE